MGGGTAGAGGDPSAACGSESCTVGQSYCTVLNVLVLKLEGSAVDPLFTEPFANVLRSRGLVSVEIARRRAPGITCASKESRFRSTPDVAGTGRPGTRTPACA